METSIFLGTGVLSFIYFLTTLLAFWTVGFWMIFCPAWADTFTYCLDFSFEFFVTSISPILIPPLRIKMQKKSKMAMNINMYWKCFFYCCNWPLFFIFFILASTSLV